MDKDMTNAKQDNLKALNEQIEGLKKIVSEQQAEITSLRAQDVEKTDLHDLSDLAARAFNDRNATAIKARDDGDLYGDDTVEFKPHWHYATPLQSLMDGLHKALYGSEFNGNRRNGAKDYRDMLIRNIIRRSASAEGVAQLGGDPIQALAGTPEGLALMDAVANQDALIAALEQLYTRVNDAYAIASNGEDYRTPQERRAAYEAQEKSADQQAASVSAQIEAYLKARAAA